MAPAPTTRQLPAKPTRLHASHAPLQPEPQHTLSAQKPDAHCVVRAQLAPFESATVQMPPLQKNPVEQSPSITHRDGQVALAPSHT